MSLQNPNSSMADDELALANYVAIEKMQYMHQFAKSSTIATILAPLLCIPIYLSSIDDWRFYSWFALMVLVVLIRFYIIGYIKLEKNLESNFNLLNWGVGITTLAWGLGWLLLIPNPTPYNYLIYEVISLTVLFVGMVGYCVNLNTFIAFVLPLKLPEFLFLALNFEHVVWPIAAGSIITFYLAIKMAFLFSKSWEKSISLRFKNEMLFNELVREKDASQAANIAKSEFIATASHDLRQPMQAINLYLELIDANKFDEKEKLFFMRFKVCVDQLNKMFNTLLDISKLDSLSVSLKKETFNSSGFLSEIHDSYLPIAKSKSLELVFITKDFTVLGDPLLLLQILRNLVSNAIQYTSLGRIEVEFLGESGFLVIEVRDTGCGIPPDEIALIQQEFYRVPSSRSMHDGLGLGLSIVNRVAKIMGATLMIDSEVGKGSVFRLLTHCPVTQLMENDGAGIGSNPFLTKNAYNALSTVVPHHFKSMHIAILEDDLQLSAAYEQFFSVAGFKVHLIPVEFNALSSNLKDINQIDFILSDFRLEHKNGVDFIQAIREEFNLDIPALILTADTSPKHLLMFKELGIQVLFKPVEPAHIIDYIKKYFNFVN